MAEVCMQWKGGMQSICAGACVPVSRRRRETEAGNVENGEEMRRVCFRRTLAANFRAVSPAAAADHVPL